MHETQSLLGLILDSNLINFAVAVSLLAYLLLKFIPDSTRKRKQELEKEIADATAAKTIAEQKLKELELAIERAKAEAITISNSAKDSAESLKRVMLDETKEQILKMQANVEREIEQQRAVSLEKIKKQITTIACAEAQRVIKDRQSEFDQLFADKLKQDIEDSKNLV